MICEKCGSGNTFVVDSRERNGFRSRRYHCHDCGRRFNTREYHEGKAIIPGEDFPSTRELRILIARLEESANRMRALLRKVESCDGK